MAPGGWRKGCRSSRHDSSECRGGPYGSGDPTYLKCRRSDTGLIDVDLGGPGVGCIGSNDVALMKGRFMNIIIKRLFTALALVVVCVGILAATKLYGIWVITGFAVFLFILGLLRKEKAPDKAGEPWDDNGNKPGQE
jgi:hypothetical protein